VRRTHVSCGVDLGSTNIKVVAVRADGTVVARYSRPTPRLSNHLSVDAEEMLTLVEEMLLEAAGRDWAIASVCVAGVGEDGVLVDATGHAVVESLPWFDPRRAQIFAELPDGVRASAAKSITGVELDAARTVVGWRWATTSKPVTTHSQLTAWIALTDYPAVRWTGRPFMSDTLASRTAAWDPTSRSWLDQVVQATLGDPRLLGPVLSAGEVVGPLTSTVLEDASVLAPGAVVVAGGHDHPIGGSLVERIRPSAVLDSMGTAEVVVRVADRLDTALVEAAEAVSVSAGLLGRGATVLAVAELARNMSWATQSDQAVQDMMSKLLRGDIELPEKPRLTDLFIIGEQGGQAPAWSPNAADASPLERAAAALTACASNGWRIIELLGSATDAPVFAAGGWTRSPGWMAAKRKLSRRPLDVIPEPEVTAVGAALIAGDALGWSPDPARASSL